MLTCRDFVAQASDHIEGHPSLRVRLAIRVHLAICVHCRRYLRQLRRLVDSMRRRHALDDPALVPDLVERILTAWDRTQEDRADPEGPNGR